MKTKKMTIVSSVLLVVFALSGFSPAVSVIAAESNGTIGAGNSKIVDLKNYLSQMRNNLKEFKDKKTSEETDRAAALKEKIASKKKTIEARIAEAKKIKEEKRKEVLLNLVDIQIKHFTNTKERVAKMPNITASLKTDLNTKIDAAIAELNAKKAKVQAATTADEIKNLTKEIRDYFKIKRDIIKEIVDAILISRMNAHITKFEASLTTLKAKIEEMKAAGKDVSSLTPLITSAEAKLAAAKTAVGKKDVKKALDALKDAYQELRKAAAKITGAPVPSATATPTPTSTPAASATPTPTV